MKLVYLGPEIALNWVSPTHIHHPLAFFFLNAHLWWQGILVLRSSGANFVEKTEKGEISGWPGWPGTRVRNVRSADFGFGDKILRRQQFHSTHSLQISLLETFSVQSRQWQTNFCWIGKHNTFYKKNIILPLYFLFQILWGLSVIFHIIGFRHNNANFGTNSDFPPGLPKILF